MHVHVLVILDVKNSVLRLVIPLYQGCSNPIDSIAVLSLPVLLACAAIQQSHLLYTQADSNASSQLKN